MLFFPLYYDILSLTSLKIIQVFHLLLGFVENQAVFWDFKIRNSVRITEGSDNGDLDNRGPTVYENVQVVLCNHCTLSMKFKYTIPSSYFWYMQL